MLRPVLLSSLLCTLLSCAPFPELEGTVTPDLEQAEYPNLVPFDQVTAPPKTETDPVSALEARAAALRARAAKLKEFDLDA